MESVQQHQLQFTSFIQLKNPSIYSYPIASIKPTHAQNSEDKINLIKAIQQLQISNKDLKQKEQLLQNQLIDLRKVLFISKEQADQEITLVHEQNKILSEEASKFSKALRYQHKQGNHLRRIALYWSQFCL